jgi:transcriptional regulator with XRE-family HTH domain
MARRDDPQIGLSKAIRQRRKEIHLSQEALGLAADLHPTWISHLESGRANPPRRNARRLAKGPRVPLPELAALAEDWERKLAIPPDSERQIRRF